MIDHVRRVAAKVPARARSVAWLHDILETTSVDEAELRVAGATDTELRSLDLLTRNPGDGYLMHIAAIARAPGMAGELARAVKRIDLADRITQVDRADGPTGAPPYRAAAVLLSRSADASDAALRTFEAPSPTGEVATSGPPRPSTDPQSALISSAAGPPLGAGKRKETR